MPIYEFRCQSCNHVFELLWMTGEQYESLNCPECGGEELLRVVSKVAPVARGGSKGSSGINLTTRSCGEGSCNTITLPGHQK